MPFGIQACTKAHVVKNRHKPSRLGQALDKILADGHGRMQSSIGSFGRKPCWQDTLGQGSTVGAYGSHDAARSTRTLRLLSQEGKHGAENSRGFRDREYTWQS